MPKFARVVFVDNSSRSPNANLSLYKFNPFPKNFDDREFLDTSKYNSSNFDLRSVRSKCIKAFDFTKLTPTNLIPSAFENPRKRTFLAKFTNEDCTNIYTNTRSFANKFARSAPKFKVVRVRKPKELEPGTGYYDMKSESIKDLVMMSKQIGRNW